MKRKKIISLFLLVFIITGSLLGCGIDKSQLPTDPPEEIYQDYEEVYEDEALPPFELEQVGHSISNDYSSEKFYYFRDITTDVLYLHCSGNRAGGLVAMLDPETGLPLTYTRYMELYNHIG